MKYEEEIQKVNEQLKDFQRVTVQYLDHRFYVEGQNRMLVADEVGLGKTLIAKGVIARAYERWCQRTPKTEEHFNVYYICANQQLISQNLKKINFTKDKQCLCQVNRISLLALKPQNEQAPIHIYALTPDTSFSQRSSQGIKEERYMLYAILSQELPREVSRHRLSNLLKGSRQIAWNVSAYSINSLRSQLRPSVQRAFVKALQKSAVKREMLPTCCKVYSLHEGMSLWDAVIQVVSQFNRRKVQGAICNELIGAMRQVMTDVCVNLMDANIYVMDEFQRYGQLLNTKSETEQSVIAQKVFGQTAAKVLLLSATPFKAFTNQYDELHNEQHYKELMRVLQFLYEGVDADWTAYEEARSKMFSLMLRLKTAAQKEPLLRDIMAAKEVVEAFLARVIVRTEKLMASNDPNAMIRNVEKQPLTITQQEIEDFVRLDTDFRAIYARQQKHAPSPIDYAKSAPYAMSFLRDYKVGELARTGKMQLAKNAFVNLHEVQNYSFPEGNCWPNGKLQLLMKDMERTARLLWCPPSLPYYALGGAFKGQADFSKTLVFSAWKLVPKMIATLVSYEAEKQSIGKSSGAKYFANRRAANQGDKARKTSRRLVFTKDKNNFTTLLLAYPSRTLVNLVDPLCFLKAGDSYQNSERQKIKDLKKAIRKFCKAGVEKGGETSHISWGYPIVNDKNREVAAWLNHGVPKIGQEDDDSLFATKYLPELRDYLAGEKKPSYPKCTKDQELSQARLMWNMALGNPGVCAYRALRRYYGDGQVVFLSAFRIGMAFISLFNKPESIAIVDLEYSKQEREYWQNVVQYCVDGNLQAVLDEYVFMLRNNYEKIDELTEAICGAISMRTIPLKVDDAASLCRADAGESDVKHRLRTHYAAAFGIQVKNSSDGEVRAASIREAFNSPFRPFVLATTSIGQEGLDFHWYCRRVVHWNLPNNPIDFEQREGRINRFRGLVIRQRVARKYGATVGGELQPWDALFEQAKADKEMAKFPCDIVPNWHFDAGDVAIERIVPLYQFSQDIQRYFSMLRVLGLYRLTFGQPRQEELAEALDCALTEEELNQLMIDLCPMRRQSKNENKTPE